MANTTNEADLAALTEEERAALGDEGLEDEIVSDEDDDQEDTRADDSDGTKQDPKAGEEDAGEATSKKQAAPEDEEAERADPILPVLRADAPENVEETLAAITKTESDLIQRFEDGEITAREYREGLNQINDQREEIKWKKRESELATKLADQAEKNAWVRDVNEFMSAQGADIVENETRLIAFDSVVKRVTGDAKNAHLSNRSQLQMALKIYRQEMGLAPAIQAEETKAKAKAKETRPIPPSLSKIPAAEPEDINNSKFARLDRLAVDDPLAFEKQVAKLSEAERQQYESAA